MGAMMGWVAAAAVLTYFTFVFDGEGKTLRLWLPGLVVLIAAPFSNLIVVPPALFIVSTAFLLLAAWRGAAESLPVLLVALSDLCLVSAVWVYHSETTLWTLPPGSTLGGPMLAAACLLRVGGTRLGRGAGSGLLSVAWWQGVVLGLWAVPSSEGLLLAGGIGIALVSLAFEPARSRFALFGSGIVLTALALGGSIPLLAAIGAATFAHVVGGGLGAFVLVAGYPLAATIPATPLVLGISAATIGLSSRIVVPKRRGGGVATLFATVALLFAMPWPRAVVLGLLTAAAFGATVAVRSLGGPEPLEIEREPISRSRPTVLLGGSLNGIALIATAALVVNGLSTGFL